MLSDAESIRIRNSTGFVNVSSEEKQDNIINSKYPSGVSSNGSVTLTLSSTSYQVPQTIPTSNYTIVLYNGSDTDMYVGYENSNINGIELPAGGRISFDIGANNSIYAYCGTAGKILTYSLKEI